MYSSCPDCGVSVSPFCGECKRRFARDERVSFVHAGEPEQHYQLCSRCCPPGGEGLVDWVSAKGFAQEGEAATVHHGSGRVSYLGPAAHEMFKKIASGEIRVK